MDPHDGLPNTLHQKYCHHPKDVQIKGRKKKHQLLPDAFATQITEEVSTQSFGFRFRSGPLHDCLFHYCSAQTITTHKP